MTNRKSFKSRLSANKKILDAKEGIPEITFFGDWAFSIIKDQGSPGGRLVRIHIPQMSKSFGKWSTVLDSKELSKKRVISDFNCLLPKVERCLVHLSKRGGDKVEIVEVDVKSGKILKNGFNVPLARTFVSWISKNQIALSTDFGSGSLTPSGNGNQVRIVSRGQALKDGEKVLDLEPGHKSIFVGNFPKESGSLTIVNQFASSSKNSFWIVDQFGSKKIPTKGASIFYGIYKNFLIFQAWTGVKFGPKEIRKGEIYGLKFSEVGKKNASPNKVLSFFKPEKGSSIYGVKVSEKGIVVNYLENVLGKLMSIQLSDRNQVIRNEIKLPRIGQHARLESSSYSNSLFLFKSEDYLSPTRLVSFSLATNQTKVIRTISPQFNAKDMTFKQYWVESSDGTKVPYFVVGKKEVIEGGNAPTILFAYGGFGVTYPPRYQPVIGKSWLEAGGIYVEANIRGGGAFGPSWHVAAIKEKRTVAFSDFIAVSKDLIKRGITTSERLGVYSGSNGGYLLGAAMVREPDLYEAIAVKVPLFDMLNFHRFLSGPNWVSEYGDPEKPSDRSFLLKLSPYQNLEKGVKYPPAFIYTSSSDDRVHPLHARKMAAKLEEYGNEVFFYESTEGGHGGSVTSSQSAYWKSMMFEFFTDKLMDQRD